MRLADLVRSVIWALAAFPGRSIALVVSLSSGLAVIVLAGALLAGFERELERLAFGPYATALVVRENVFVADRHGPPRVADGALISDGVSGVQAIAGWSSGRGQIWTGSESVIFDLFGVTGRYELELDTPVVSGRLISPGEVETGARVCLVGAELAGKLGPDMRAGDLRIGGVACRVVGVLGFPRARPAARFMNAVITPVPAVQRYFDPQPDRVPGQVDWITVFMASGTHLDDTEMKVDLLLRRARGAPLSRPSPFSYGDPSATLRQQREQQALVRRLTVTLATLSLAASLLAYGSIASAALVARTREFALRLATGAEEGDLQRQVLGELCLIGLISSGLGLSLGLALGAAAAWFWSWPYAPSWSLAAIAICAGLGAGAGVGLLLVRRVSRLSPGLASN